ncbi:MAG: hypothetical protein LUH58_08820, partial [Lachnospiraceae bacterium]|nr:hypothetical protein [Lachnospiraceae bacterium]
YLKSGKLRYSVGVHMALNLMGILAGVSLLGFTAVEDSLGNLSSAQMMELIPFFVCIAVEVLCLIAGLVFFCLGIRRMSFERAELELPKGTKLKTVFLNAGMILYALVCIAIMVIPGIF